MEFHILKKMSFLLRRKINSSPKFTLMEKKNGFHSTSLQPESLPLAKMPICTQVGSKLRIAQLGKTPPAAREAWA